LNVQTNINKQQHARTIRTKHDERWSLTIDASKGLSCSCSCGFVYSVVIHYFIWSKQKSLIHQWTTNGCSLYSYGILTVRSCLSTILHVQVIICWIIMCSYVLFSYVYVYCLFALLFYYISSTLFCKCTDKYFGENL
jgi:hypothetical protein